ncbi:MAG TPA: trehalose-phosphatase [Acidimicrobiales bacterium]|nr:trehalose-phosphatase [Acidimicrobiales bacterium]
MADDGLFERFRSHPHASGILCDFDGTLAPIVDDPDASRPLPEAVDLLHRLAAVYRRVAVISGRPAGFLAAHLELAAHSHGGAAGDGLVAVGLYGLERAEGDRVDTDPRVEEWLPVIEEVAALADAEAPEGVFVERKRLSLALHYRTAPSHTDWATSWSAAQADRTGLLRHPARMSEELRPPLPVDKGTVVAGLAEDLGAVCFLGDDVGDVPAFDSLDELARTRPMAAVKVAVRSEESPEALLDAADLVVDGPEGVVDLLRCLLEPPPS